MNATRNRNAAGRIGLAFAACMLAAAMSPSVSRAVEYVRICDTYGDGYSYLPGTDTCVNASNNDARVETAGGTWRYRIPNNPIEWIQAPRKICRGGRLLDFGILDGTKFFNNAHDRVETTTQVPITLGDREYVSSVIYKGDLTGAGGDFCLFYTYTDMVEGVVYQPLGCGNPTSNGRQAALLSYAPDIQPPDTTNPVFLVGASGRPWTPVPSSIGGTLEVWVCVKKTKLAL